MVLLENSIMGNTWQVSVQDSGGFKIAGVLYIPRKVYTKQPKLFPLFRYLKETTFFQCYCKKDMFLISGYSGSVVRPRYETHPETH